MVIKVSRQIYLDRSCLIVGQTFSLENEKQLGGMHNLIQLSQAIVLFIGPEDVKNRSAHFAKHG